MFDTNCGAVLSIPEIKVSRTKIDNGGHFLIYAGSTMAGAICHGCGKEIDKPYGHDRELRIRHLAIFGREAYIMIRLPRYQCLHCEGHPITTQQVPWRMTKSSYTVDYEQHILLSLVNSTIQDVSFEEGLGYGAVEGIMDRHINSEVDWGSIKNLGVIGIDEIALKKGHKDFVTIITTHVGDKIHLLAVLKDKQKDTVKKFFLSIPKKLRKTVKFICSDMYDGFINAAKEVFSRRVKIVIDRFHVAKLYRNNFDELRKTEMRRLKKELTEEEYKKLKNVMWILRKKSGAQTQEDVDVLKRLFKHSPLLEMAYKFRNNLTDIFDETLSKPQARRKLKSWINKIRKSGLTCFDGFIKTLENRMNDILNYFVNRQTSGFVEGLNNKIKVIKRRCYGILNVKNLFQRIHLDLAGYEMFS